MKARPGALEHELVLCIFDCFNKTIAFEQVNLEISLMATPQNAQAFAMEQEVVLLHF